MRHCSKKVTLSLDNGKQIVINAAANSADNKYINSLKYNGQNYDKNWLSHTDLVKGAILDFNMTPVPNKTRGISEADFPYSMSTEKK